jgi:hypothetical protein
MIKSDEPYKKKLERTPASRVLTTVVWTTDTCYARAVEISKEL